MIPTCSPEMRQAGLAPAPSGSLRLATSPVPVEVTRERRRAKRPEDVGMVVLCTDAGEGGREGGLCAVVAAPSGAGVMLATRKTAVRVRRSAVRSN